MLRGKIQKGDRVSWSGAPATVTRAPYGLLSRKVDFITDKAAQTTPTIATDDEDHFREVATRLEDRNAARPVHTELSQFPQR